MNQPTKTDQRAAERLLKRAVTQAIARLRQHPSPGALLGLNARQFEIAIAGADMLLATNHDEETTAC